jgi:hypothetical protein
MTGEELHSQPGGTASLTRPRATHSPWRDLDLRLQLVSSFSLSLVPTPAFEIRRVAIV